MSNTQTSTADRLNQVCAALAVLAIAIFATATVAYGHATSSTIGGTTVPELHCQEDETIWWVGIDTLACVHADTIN